MPKYVVLNATSRAEAENYAQGMRHALRRKGEKVAGRVKISKTATGYRAYYRE